MDNTNNPAEPKSFALYKGKAPLLIQIIGGLMWLQGLFFILAGIPLLFIFGFGIIFMVLGVFVIKYAKAMFRMQAKGFKGFMILEGIALILSVVNVIMLGVSEMSTTDWVQLAYPLVAMGIVYSYKDSFVN